MFYYKNIKLYLDSIKQNALFNLIYVWLNIFQTKTSLLLYK